MSMNNTILKLLNDIQHTMVTMNNMTIVFEDGEKDKIDFSGELEMLTAVTEDLESAIIESRNKARLEQCYQHPVYLAEMMKPYVPNSDSSCGNITVSNCSIKCDSYEQENSVTCLGEKLTGDNCDIISLSGCKAKGQDIKKEPSPLKSYINQLIEDDYKWVAKDKDGNMYAYTSKPVIPDFEKVWESREYKSIEDSLFPKWYKSLKWHESLVKLSEFLDDDFAIAHNSKEYRDCIHTIAEAYNKGFEFVAMSKDGIAFGYTEEPVIRSTFVTGKWDYSGLGSQIYYTVDDPLLLRYLQSLDWDKSLRRIVDLPNELKDFLNK